MTAIEKKRGVTDYSGLAKFYFRYLIRQIIKTGELGRKGITILDFGCGNGELKLAIPEARVIGYDIVPELTDVEDWRAAKFDVFVANEVFYSFTESELTDLIVELKASNSKLELVVGISRQSILNNIGKYLLGRPDAHSATRLGPEKELEVLCRHCDIRRKRNVLFLADVFVLTFK